MIIHSKDFVTGLDESCIQPNAVDLRIHAATRLGTGCEGRSSVYIRETGPKEFIYRQPLGLDDEGCFVLEPKQTYDVVSQHSVEIPEGMVGWLIIRSTLARNGCLLGNGLYDSGYAGAVGGIIHNLSEVPIHIEYGARFAQFIMAKAETSHLYSGHYNQNGGLSN